MRRGVPINQTRVCTNETDVREEILMLVGEEERMFEFGCVYTYKNIGVGECVVERKERGI
jgi:hypothetical protein